MRQENFPRFDDTTTRMSVQAGLFKADSFEELHDVDGELADAVLLKKRPADLPVTVREVSYDDTPTVVEESAPDSAGLNADGAAAPDNKAVKRTAMFERRRRRNTRGRRTMRARGAPRLCMY